MAYLEYLGYVFGYGGFGFGILYGSILCQYFITVSYMLSTYFTILA